MARLFAFLTMSFTCAVAVPAAVPRAAPRAAPTGNTPYGTPPYYPNPYINPRMESKDSCQHVQQQLHMDLNKMSGWWYVVETIGHRIQDRTNRSGYTNLTVCPIIHVKVDDKKLSIIHMTWEEPKGAVTYRFQIPSEDDPGFWVSLGQQNGSYVENPRLQYRQFAGSVQVLKAVASHVVLRFCSPQTHHYTVVMARQYNISQFVVDEVNKMIEERGLYAHDIRRACVGAASALLSTLPILILAINFVYFAPRLF